MWSFSRRRADADRAGGELLGDQGRELRGEASDNLRIVAFLESEGYAGMRSKTAKPGGMTAQSGRPLAKIANVG